MKKILNVILSVIIIAFVFLSIIAFICAIGWISELICPNIALDNIFETGIVMLGILFGLGLIIYFIIGIFLFIYKVISTH